MWNMPVVEALQVQIKLKKFTYSRYGLSLQL